MIHRALRIGRWVVDFLFSTGEYDPEGVFACLYECGANSEVLDRVQEIMIENKPNCAFTFTNPRRHRAVVVTGPVTSGAEFQDSFAYEIHHLAVAIAEDLGFDLRDEEPAYLAGDSTRALTDVLCHLGCPRCNEKEPRASRRMARRTGN